MIKSLRISIPQLRINVVFDEILSLLLTILMGKGAHPVFVPAIDLPNTCSRLVSTIAVSLKIVVHPFVPIAVKTTV